MPQYSLERYIIQLFTNGKAVGTPLEMLPGTSFKDAKKTAIRSLKARLEHFYGRGNHSVQVIAQVHTDTTTPEQLKVGFMPYSFAEWKTTKVVFEL